MSEPSPAAKREAGLGPATNRSSPERMFVAALLTLSAIAWLTVHRLATPDMRLGILTGAARPHSSDAAMPMSHLLSAALFLVMWLVMMAAMMFPAVTPVLARVGSLTRARGARGGAVYAVATGYLLVWCAVGAAAYGLFVGFQAVASMGEVLAVRIGAIVLLVAGVYQLTSLKTVCLRRCRSPLAVVVRHGEAITRNRTGALRAGIHHGAFCVGCCWALMAVLLAAGAMSLVWMGVIAALVLIEKVHRRGEALSKVLGSLLIIVAAALVAAPDLLVGLT